MGKKETKAVIYLTKTRYSGCCFLIAFLNKLSELCTLNSEGKIRQMFESRKERLYMPGKTSLTLRMQNEMS